MIKRYKNEIFFFYIAAMAALIAAAFCDLQLDKLLNNTENIIAIWFKNTGEIPGRLICPFAGTVLFYTYKNKIQQLAGAIITLGGSAYFGYYIGKYFFIDEHRMLFSIIYGLGFGITCLIIGKFIAVPDKHRDMLRQIAILSIIIMFVQITVIEGMKYLWGRVRFRDLLAAGSYDSFTPWYKINGINGNKSFPSGHTAGAGMSYLMMAFPYLSKKWERQKTLCFVIPLVYTSVVAFTRLVMGAHYLSDVAMGGIVSFTIVIIAFTLYEKKFLKNQ
ncbi:MAG: phosphatase PAP2 family protein [Eubacterium sp.]|nr:phosphatase PAP2 family protein [Eubacterium sp.]MDE5974107.1 phosphatase PAP2 family protein [Eubacterium sp.]